MDKIEQARYEQITLTGCFFTVFLLPGIILLLSTGIMTFGCYSAFLKYLVPVVVGMGLVRTIWSMVAWLIMYLYCKYADKHQAGFIGTLTAATSGMRLFDWFLLLLRMLWVTVMYSAGWEMVAMSYAVMMMWEAAFAHLAESEAEMTLAEVTRDYGTKENWY